MNKATRPFVQGINISSMSYEHVRAARKAAVDRKIKRQGIALIIFCTAVILFGIFWVVQYGIVTI